MINPPPQKNFPILKWIIFIKSVSNRNSMGEYFAVGIVHFKVSLFYNKKVRLLDVSFFPLCFYSMCVFQRVFMY